MDSSDLSGFDPHVRDQLSRMSLNQTQHDSSRSSSPLPQNSVSHRGAEQRSTYGRGRNQYHQTNRALHFQPQAVQMPPGSDAFPPLGAPMAAPNNSRGFTSHSAYNQNAVDRNEIASAAAQDFFHRARGRGRGRGSRQSNRGQQMPFNDFERPARSTEQNLYQAGPPYRRQNYTPAHTTRHRTIEQSDFLDHIAKPNLANMLSVAEIGQKQKFSTRLEGLARQVVHQNMPSIGTSPSSKARLQPYGSVVNSFGLAGCDVDLLLTIEPREGVYEEVSDVIKRDLEKVLLDSGIGARLLANTRVPILQVCERPSQQLLSALRDKRTQWETEQQQLSKSELASKSNEVIPLPSLTAMQREAQVTALEKLDENATAVPLPVTPPPDNSRLEFSNNCGNQCDINFTGRVALHNTHMLWTYGQIDQRVRLMGVFVKNWAKARDINTPYHGTLSSYGYVLMVLHYCINVAKPPLVPNLQYLAKNNGWNDEPTELFEGYDTRYESDMTKIRQAMVAEGRNKNSLGGLLRGFFQYYSSPGGFRWVDETISIRSPGGIISKQEKGWIKAKWSEDNNNVRQRYLLALEDPFELTHNVGRTVGHNGICAIRDEFRRAYNIIDNIQGPGSNWTWTSRDGQQQGQGSDLLARDTAHGDTLKKDADARKLRQMKEKLEAQEIAARKKTLQPENGSAENFGTFGMEDKLLDALPTDSDPTALIHDIQRKDQKVSKMRSRLPQRERQGDAEADDDSDSDDPVIPHHGHTNSNSSKVAPEISSQLEAGLDNVSEVRSHTWSEVDEHATKEQSTEPEDIPHNEWSKNTNRAIQPDLPAIHLVGSNIQWTTKSKAGRWLLWRDEAIRSGTWRYPTAGDGGKLHATFPYDPNMTMQELDRLNAKLERFYKDSLHPRRTSHNNDNTTWGGKIEVPIDHAALVEETKQKIADGPEEPEEPEQPYNDVQSWLDRRDMMAARGEWRPDAPEDSVFGELLKLYPYCPIMSTQDRLLRKKEIATFFSGVMLPRREAPSGEDGFKAILKLQKYRKDDREAARIKSLMKIFEHEAVTALDEARHKQPLPLSIDNRKEVEQQALNAVRALSTQDAVPSLAEKDDINTVREKRLAYYDKLQPVRPIEQGQVIPSITDHQRRDSAAKGSWNDTNSTSNCKEPIPSLLEVEANNDQQVEAATYSGDPFERTDPHDPATTDESAGEVIPNSLHPNTWRHFKGKRHEDPRIMPFPRTPNFPFDQRQLRDMNVITSGSNGCVRGANSPYLLESDKHSWGGAGAMAQKPTTSQIGTDISRLTVSDLSSRKGSKEGTALDLLHELPCRLDFESPAY